MAVWLGIFTKNHCIVHFKWVNFMVCKLHLNEVINKEKKKPLEDFKQGESDHSAGEIMG